ncbi:uncharacterized protein LOC143191484 [Rhynchophorus ferrugineus]|uniref:uncharacterized protein LOC143191484 n=1 Tax=Rhynchophorus ferrugineus TaxID=354439 RepID=UPI003FCDFFC5
MRHHHRWPHILVCLSICIALATESAASTPKTRHFHRQVHRLVGGHLTHDVESDDSELITASAGDNTKSKKGGKHGEDDRKTLSQQVADGKYGLIQKELFQSTPKRPGIISYATNTELPQDNIATLGGLTKNDIWLSENHLLVIRGGVYPPHDDTKQENVGQVWQPIDDYNAPLHQVKIPKNPKIPPPFPVQLTDDGPLQILGTNSSRTLNESSETPAYALPPPPDWDGEIPPQSQYFPQAGTPDTDPAHPAAGKAPVRGTVPGEPGGGMPFPPALLNGSSPPYSAHSPPEMAILSPPLGNGTEPEIIDEDDPSIYYPPPYSFFYPRDNTSLVPPGPLVPGIILPPPPKFFAALEEDPPATTTTTAKPRKTIPTRVTVIKNYGKATTRVVPSRKTTGRPQTTKLVKTTTTSTTDRPKIISILPVHVAKLNRTYLPPTSIKKKPAVTVLRPVKQNTIQPHKHEENNNRHRLYNNEFVTTTQVPLKFHTTTSTNVEVPPLTRQQPERFTIGVNAHQRPKTTSKPTNYFFYEETDPSINVITTERPAKTPNFYEPPPKYQTIQAPTPVTKPHFMYINDRPRFRPVTHNEPQPRPNTFRVHVAKLQQQLHQYYNNPKTPSKPVYQYSFEAQNFRPSPQINGQGDGFKPMPKYSVQIQQAIEILPSQRPSYQHNQPLKVQEPPYLATKRPSSGYDARPTARPQYQQEVQKLRDFIQVTPAKTVAEFSFEATPNPLLQQGFYTEPDEGYFDERTRQSFTVFGQKLPSTTTSLPPQSNFPRQQSGQYRQPISLHNDIKVNYANPRPPINPDSESIHFNQQYHPVNRPEIIKAIEIPPPSNIRNGNDGYIQYQLPGDDGAHFYFLTPQQIQRKRQSYPYQREDRIRRDNRSENKKTSAPLKTK